MSKLNLVSQKLAEEHKLKREDYLKVKKRWEGKGEVTTFHHIVDGEVLLGIHIKTEKIKI
jgi:hypothetical protein